MTTQADLQAAIDVASLAGGGVVEFRGTVDCAPVGSAEQCLIIRSGVTLSGGGSGRLRLVPGRIVLHTGMVRFDEGARDAAVQGLTVDGNRSSGADVCGVAGSSGGRNLRLSFVTLRACEHRSLITNGSPSTQPFVEGFVVEHSLVLDAGDKAFQFRNTRGGSCGGGTVRNLVRGAIVMERRTTYGNRQGTSGPAAGWT